MLKLYDLITEYKREPLGLDETQPRFGRTNYRKRLQYQICAVTLHSGKNHLALTLANGWYKGKLGFMPQPNHYGDTNAALAALCITYEDGHERNGSVSMKAGFARPVRCRLRKFTMAKRRTLRQTPPHRSPPDCLTTALTPSSFNCPGVFWWITFAELTGENTGEGAVYQRPQRLPTCCPASAPTAL